MRFINRMKTVGANNEKLQQNIAQATPDKVRYSRL